MSIFQVVNPSFTNLPRVQVDIALFKEACIKPVMHFALNTCSDVRMPKVLRGRVVRWWVDKQRNQRFEKEDKFPAITVTFEITNYLRHMAKYLPIKTRTRNFKVFIRDCRWMSLWPTPSPSSTVPPVVFLSSKQMLLLFYEKQKQSLTIRVVSWSESC